MSFLKLYYTSSDRDREIKILLLKICSIYEQIVYDFEDQLIMRARESRAFTWDIFILARGIMTRKDGIASRRLAEDFTRKSSRAWRMRFTSLRVITSRVAQRQTPAASLSVLANVTVTNGDRKRTGKTATWPAVTPPRGTFRSYS